MSLQLREPQYHSVNLSGSDAEVQATVSNVFERFDESERNATTGQKKIILSWDDPIH